MFRLAFRSGGNAAEPESEPVEGPPEIEFVAYAEDCVLSGRVRLAADRLSDLVNASDQVELIDVLVTDLVGGEPIEVHELVIGRPEILLLHATGPRGRADRRQRTRQIAISASLGPYEVSGYLHVRPGSDALTSLQRALPFVALSDAIVEYNVDGRPQRQEVQSALLNWALANRIVEVAEKPADETGDEPQQLVLIDLSAEQVRAAAAAMATELEKTRVAGAA